VVVPPEVVGTVTAIGWVPVPRDAAVRLGRRRRRR